MDNLLVVLSITNMEIKIYKNFLLKAMFIVIKQIKKKIRSSLTKWLSTVKKKLCVEDRCN